MLKLYLYNSQNRSLRLIVDVETHRRRRRRKEEKKEKGKEGKENERKVRKRQKKGSNVNS